MLSAVILNWKRKENLPAIVAELSKSLALKEIILWNNNREVALVSGEAKVIVINSSHNYICHARYAAALIASYESILFQDDDLLLPVQTVETLLQRQKAEPARIHGLFGRRLKSGHYAELVDGVDAEVPILAGRCLMFKRELALDYFKLVNQPPLLDIKRSSGVDLDDLVFSYAVRISTGNLHRTWALPFSELPSPHPLCEKTLHFQARDKAVQVLEQYVAAAKALAR